jgi:hypothetical protein
MALASWVSSIGERSVWMSSAAIFSRDGKPGQHSRLGKLAEDFPQYKLLAVHAAQVPELVVAIPEESLQFLPLQNLQTGVKIDVQPLGIVDVVHALGHIHFHPAEGIGQPGHGIQIHFEMAFDRDRKQSGYLRLGDVGACQAIESVGLEHPVIRGFYVGIPRYLGDAGGVAVDLNGEHDVGVSPHLIGAHHQDETLADADGLHDGGQAVGGMDQAGDHPSQLGGEGSCHTHTQRQAQSKGVDGKAPGETFFVVGGLLGAHQQFGNGRGNGVRLRVGGAALETWKGSWKTHLAEHAQQSDAP